VTTAEGGTMPVVCGTDGCSEVLIRRGDDAVCSTHGVVVDGAFTPPPPLEGPVHLNYGGGRGEWVDLRNL
jgi:hypothetical protein